MSEYLPIDPGPYGADTDDAVSALIDGELAGFAADRGQDVATVQATLDAWGGLAARRARLESARHALRTPLTLDDPTRAAMVAAALAVEPDAAPVVPFTRNRSRRTAVLAAFGAAAAVLLIGVGVGTYVVGNRSNTTSTAERASTTIPANGGGQTDSGVKISPNATGLESSSSDTRSDDQSASTTAATTGRTTVPSDTDLGEVSDPKTLIAKVQRSIPAAPITTTPGATAVTAAPNPQVSCASGSLFPAGSAIVLETTASFNGRTAQVIAAQLAGRTTVYVLEPTGCSILSAVAF